MATARLKTRYVEEIRPALVERFSYTTPMQAPRVQKVTVNMGVGEAKQDSKMLDAASEQLGTITGQKPNIRRARKSIAQFKVREGMPVGVAVTLRGERQYEFLDRLMSIAIPRIRDFRGLNPQVLRRTRQLLAGRSRADHLPRGRLRRDRSGPRPRHHDHHVSGERRGGIRPPRGARYAIFEGRPLAGGRHAELEEHMAKTSQRVRQQRPPKYKTRGYTRCRRCGRARSVYRKFGICRICLRELAHNGYIPGMTKSSW